MAKKIEILENTLLKLLVRRGDNADRLNVTLSEGELGYTIDSQRLFVGDSTTVGGIVVGNKWKGSVADISSITDAIDGDYAFESSSNIFYVKTETGWLSAGRILEAADTTIDINDSNGTIAVGTISGDNISVNALGNSIELASNQISLSSTQIKTDRISAHSASYLSLPGNLNINTVNYKWPVGGLGSGQYYLNVDAFGNLNWDTPDKSSTFYFNSSAAAIPVGTIVPVASGSSMPTGWLLCDGQSVAGADYPELSAVFGSQYGGDDVNFNLPNYTGAVLVGSTDPASFTAGTLTNSGADYATYGAVYFIKASPDSVVETTLTVTGNLTASKDGSDVSGSGFSLLDGSVEIGSVVPGVSSIDTATDVLSTFTTKALYTKFWITGSGAKGGTRTGGAAATVYGVLSAPIGTTVSYNVGAGQTTGNSDGNPSYISIGGTELARSVGAEFQTSGLVPDGTTNTGNLSTNGTGLAGGESAYILGGYVIPGGRGGWDTNDGGEDVGGTASYWGADNAPGAGAGGHNGDSVDTADGLVKFEWGM